MLLRTIFSLVIFLAAMASNAQSRDNPDAIVLRRAQLVSQTERIEVYRDEVDIDEGFAAEIDRICLAIEAQLCSRRLNIDPPCRFNIDPGRVVAV
jgi:hypothetical protein